MDFRVLTDELLADYTASVIESPLIAIGNLINRPVPVDYFEFYKSVSSVYSSRIEGEEIDFDSYFKHRFLQVNFKPDYTKKADDLYQAYHFIERNKLTFQNVLQAHSILSSNLLPESQQGVIRTNPMYVINSDDRIEYVAVAPGLIIPELDKLFLDIDLLHQEKLNPIEIFYYAALIHLVFVKIHPFQDGNGRTARLIEKWFLIEKLGKKATCIPSEKNYFRRLEEYYKNIRKLGLEYDQLDYSKALDFLLMTVNGMQLPE